MHFARPQYLELQISAQETIFGFFRYSNLGPVTFREATVAFYFLILVTLWFFQVPKTFDKLINVIYEGH